MCLYINIYIYISHIPHQVLFLATSGSIHSNCPLKSVMACPQIPGETFPQGPQGRADAPPAIIWRSPSLAGGVWFLGCVSLLVSPYLLPVCLVLLGSPDVSLYLSPVIWILLWLVVSGSPDASLLVSSCLLFVLVVSG